MTFSFARGPAHRCGRLISFCTALLIACAGAAWAQDETQAPPSDADVERLLTAARAQSLLDTMLPQMEAMQQQQLAQATQGRELSAQQRQQLDRIQARTTEIMRRALAWEAMRPLYIDLYKKTFSKQDVEAMTAFYESPAGRSLLDKTPTLMQHLMGAIQEKMAPLFKELEGDLQQIAAEGAGAGAVGAVDAAESSTGAEARTQPPARNTEP